MEYDLSVIRSVVLLIQLLNLFSRFLVQNKVQNLWHIQVMDGAMVYHISLGLMLNYTIAVMHLKGCSCELKFT